MNTVLVAAVGGPAVAKAVEEAIAKHDQPAKFKFSVESAAVPGARAGKIFRVQDRDYRITKITKTSDTTVDLHLDPDLEADFQADGVHIPVLRQPGAETRPIPSGCTDAELKRVLFDNWLVSIGKKHPLMKRGDRRRLAEAESREQYRQIKAEEKRLREEDRNGPSSSSAS